MTNTPEPTPEDIALAQKLREYHEDDPLTEKLWGLETKAHAAIVEAGKALAILNSAGAAATLAFAQALITKDAVLLKACKPFFLFALSVFLLGALISSVIAIPIAHRITGRALGSRSKGFADAARFLVWAVLAFFVASVAILFALALHL